MTVTVEFFGIARRRAGIERLDVEAKTLGEVLAGVGQRLPHWKESCLQNGRLANTFLASRNGLEFLTNPAEPLADGDSLLILSADVGG